MMIMVMVGPGEARPELAEAWRGYELNIIARPTTIAGRQVAYCGASCAASEAAGREAKGWHKLNFSSKMIMSEPLLLLL